MKRFLAWILVLASLCSLTACAAGTQNGTREPGTADSPDAGGMLLAAPEPPQTVQRPNFEDYEAKDGTLDMEAYNAAYEAWQNDRTDRLALDDGWSDGMQSFFLTTSQQYLAGTDGENRVYSPLSLYLALAMLAECTDGESRAQLLSLLGSESIEIQRKKASALWSSTYCDDGQTKCLPGSSVWLNRDIDFRQETMDALAEHYRAASYRGEMGSAALNEALQSWLNEQTGGLLKDAVKNITLRPQTVIALASTLYFRAAWQNEFYAGATRSDTFHTPSGDVTCDFMHGGDAAGYYWGEKFEAVCLRFDMGGAMWLVLPREGHTPEELLTDEEAQRFLASGGDWANCKSQTVNLTLPKFDVSADFDLKDGLMALGVRDVFDASVSDFTPLAADAEALAVTKAQHAARVKIDEEGCEAAAFTVMGVERRAMVSEVIDLCFDRPFLFLVTAENEQPLFAGIVNNPLD